MSGTGGIGELIPATTKYFPDASQLLARHQVTVTHSLGRANSSVENVFFPHRLVPSDSGDSVNFLHRHIQLKSSSLNFINYGADIEVVVRDLDRQMYIMVIPLAGEAQIAHAGHSFDLLPGQYMIIDPRSRFDCFLSPEHYHLAFGIPCWQMNQTVERSTGAACIHPSFPRERLTISDEDRGFFGLLSYVCREINEPGSALCLPMIARMIEDSLLSMLALRFLGLASKDNFQALSADGPMPKYIRQAEKFMVAHLTEPIGAADVAAAVGAPVRTLYHAFKQFRGQPPLAWLRTQRLRSARQDILEARNPERHCH